MSHVLDQYDRPPLRLESDDEAHTLTLCVLTPADRQPVSRLVLSWPQARTLAHWVLEMTRADPELNS